MSIVCRIFCFIFLWSSFLSCKKAHVSSPNPDESTITKLYTSEIFSSAGGTVNLSSSLLIDKAGNKWMASLGSGILKFDGTNWERFTASNSSFPTSNSVVHFEDSEGRIYFTSGYSDLVRYSKGQWNTWKLSGIITPKQLFFNAADQSVYVFDGESIYTIKITSDFSVKSNYIRIGRFPSEIGSQVRCLYFKNSFYVIANSKTYKMTLNGSVSLSEGPGTLNSEAFHVSNQGEAYVINGAKIHKFTDNNWILIGYNHEFPIEPRIEKLAVDDYNQVYVIISGPDINCKNCGLAKIRDNKLEFIFLNNKQIVTLAPMKVDKDNNLWIVVFEGLLKISKV